MAICHQCQKREADTGLLCSHCVRQNQEKNKIKVSQAKTIQQVQVSTHRGINLQTLLWIAAAIIIVFYFFKGSILGYGSFPVLKLQAANGASYDPCEGRHRCLVIFMTPWCPACKSSIPLTRALQSVAEERDDLGVAVYIGNDDSSSLREMAMRFQPPAFIDPNSEAKRGIGKSSVPCWALLDEQRNILDRGAGLRGGLRRSHPSFAAEFERLSGLTL